MRGNRNITGENRNVSGKLTNFKGGKRNVTGLYSSRPINPLVAISDTVVSNIGFSDVAILDNMATLDRGINCFSQLFSMDLVHELAKIFSKNRSAAGH